MKPLIFLITGLVLTAVTTVGLMGVAHPDLGKPPPPRPAEDGGRRISPLELSHHASAKDCWIAVGDRVYDVTAYIDAHPAPPSMIVDTCGTDATVAFETKNRGRAHSPQARKLLETMRVGDYAR